MSSGFAAETLLSQRVSFASPLYCEVMDFLIEEAWMLDDGRFDEWLQLMAEDLEYFMPTRETVQRANGAGFSDSMGHFDETRASLQIRVKRVLESPSAWTETPPSRTRRVISNVQVRESDSGEVLVRSVCLLFRNRLNNPTFDILPCTREDVLRRNGESFLLVRRRILVDQSTLGTANLSMFF
ncbi:MAG TPA: aromatic-ring-hydroxylating dioxygenase subunit beta [Ilumatobacteraceae bacterium]|jgi:3-phenylpropionate/cinnamic acid dioxygenase small subunit